MRGAVRGAENGHLNQAAMIKSRRRHCYRQRPKSQCARRTASMTLRSFAPELFSPVLYAYGHAGIISIRNSVNENVRWQSIYTHI